MVRVGFVVGNALLLLGVVLYVVPTSRPSVVAISKLQSRAGTTTISTSPLDQVSSSDIAVTLARLSNLPEATAITNQADSQHFEQTAALSSGTTSGVVSKPQIVATALKSRKDIQTYTTVGADNMASIAAKFGVTSDSIKWSNNLTSAIVANQKLLIPPVNGIVYTTKAGDTPDSLATTYKADKNLIIAYNDAEIAGLRPGEQIILPNAIQPVAAVRASVYSSFAVAYGGGLAWGASAVYGNNGYDYGYCTWYVSNRRAELGRPVPSNLGNAYSWYRGAVSIGLQTGLTPQNGAVMVSERGNHVAVIERLNSDGSFWISEMNSYGQRSMTDSSPGGGWGRVDYKLMPAAKAGNFKYIY